MRHPPCPAPATVASSAFVGVPSSLTRRAFLGAGGALVVGFAWQPSAIAAEPTTGATGAAGSAATRTLALDAVDAFLAVRRDGSVVVYSGKVDLGTGHRIAMRQIVGEELSLSIGRIDLVEGDTALTPNQGPTAGSSGVMRGGMELRQAAVTAREALLALAARRLAVPVEALEMSDGSIGAETGQRVGIGEFVGERRLAVKMNPKAPLKSPAQYTLVGQSLPRPDVPAKVTGRHVYVHDHAVPGMLHGRVVRPPAVGAHVLSIDAASVARLPGVRVVHIADFVGVVAADEWAALRAARELSVRWSDSAALVGHDALVDWARRGPFVAHETISTQGDAAQLDALRAATPGPTVLAASYVWPVQSHASIGPSCAVADVRADAGTVWTAS